MSRYTRSSIHTHKCILQFLSHFLFLFQSLSLSTQINLSNKKIKLGVKLQIVADFAEGFLNELGSPMGLHLHLCFIHPLTPTSTPTPTPTHTFRVRTLLKTHFLLFFSHSLSSSLSFSPFSSFLFQPKYRCESEPAISSFFTRDIWAPWAQGTLSFSSKHTLSHAHISPFLFSFSFTLSLSSSPSLSSSVPFFSFFTQSKWNHVAIVVAFSGRMYLLEALGDVGVALNE